ncbi:Blue copper protein [Nymphaea thermarum]|nr:Blue copper protein [Nymphaea thermarum]
MASLRLLLAFTVMAMLVNVSLCANYTVGAPNGSWDISTSLQAWSSSQTFNPGDYAPMHDLVEVTKADYDSCQVTNPINTHTDGNTAINLNTIGKRYFICGVPGHCNLGMKVQIETVAPGAQPHPFALPPADQVPELAPSGSPLATFYPGYPLINSGTYSSSSGTQLPPPASSSSSPTKFSAFMNWVPMLILLLLLWLGF